MFMYHENKIKFDFKTKEDLQASELAGSLTGRSGGSKIVMVAGEPEKLD